MILDPKRFNLGPAHGDFSGRCGALVIKRDPLTLSPKLKRAICTYCSNTAISKPDLSHYTKIENGSMDAYYCGCMGWD